MIQLRELDDAARRLVTPEFRAGTDGADFADYVRDLRLGRPVDVEPVRTVVDEVCNRYSRDQRAEADAWLAPRLHYTLRLSRREAANNGIWRWLGCVGAPDYVRWRWGEPDGDPAPAERFVGPVYKQAFARLWWMAEQFRNGPDYGPVAAALMNQDIPNNLFRMDIAHHRPTVQAAVRVLNGKSGREANALAKAINAAATTLAIDVIAPDEAPDSEATQRWLAQAQDVDPIAYLDALPPGPDEAVIPDATIDVMEVLLADLLAEAPVRGRG